MPTAPCGILKLSLLQGLGKMHPCCLPLMEKPTEYIIICAEKHDAILMKFFGLDFAITAGESNFLCTEAIRHY